MSHSYRELYYHLVWSTKNRAELITAEIKPILLNLLTDKARSLGCQILTSNCVSDHVHLLLYIPPTLAISTAINGLKGTTSHRLKPYQPDFNWQQGYAIFTLRHSELPVIRNYILNQEQHHQEGSTLPSWESPID